MKGNSTPCAFVWHSRVSLVSSLSFWQRGCVFVFVSLAVRWCLCICLFLCLFLCIFLCICLSIVFIFVFVFLAVSCRSSRSILGASGDVSSLSPAPTLQLAGSLDKRKTFVLFGGNFSYTLWTKGKHFVLFGGNFDALLSVKFHQQPSQLTTRALWKRKTKTRKEKYNGGTNSTKWRQLNCEYHSNV